MLVEKLHDIPNRSRLASSQSNVPSSRVSIHSDRSAGHCDLGESLEASMSEPSGGLNVVNCYFKNPLAKGQAPVRYRYASGKVLLLAQPFGPSYIPITITEAFLAFVGSHCILHHFRSRFHFVQPL
jgi:hypothetical protein